MDKSLLGSYDVNALITVLTSLSTVFHDARAQGTIERLQTISEQHARPSLTVDLNTYRTEPESLSHLRAGIANHQAVQFDYINSKMNARPGKSSLFDCSLNIAAGMCTDIAEAGRIIGNSDCPGC